MGGAGQQGTGDEDEDEDEENEEDEDEEDEDWDMDWSKVGYHASALALTADLFVDPAASSIRARGSALARVAAAARRVAARSSSKHGKAGGAVPTPQIACVSSSRPISPGASRPPRPPPPR